MTIDGYCTLGEDREYDLDEAGLLAAMDRAGVERAVIAPVERLLAVRNREGNDQMLRAAAAHPDRFIPACTVNPWYGDDGLTELRRAVAAGARLLVLHPAVQGFLANDELVWPLVEAAAAAQVPVYVHTGPPGAASPWQAVDLAERFPEADVIVGHSGATDFWNDAGPAARGRPNVYLEASLARPFVFVAHLEIAGYDRGIMGSAAPLDDLEFEWEQMRQALPVAARDAVCGGTLARLLAKRGGR